MGLFYFFAFAQLQSISSVFFKDVLAWDPGRIGVMFLILGFGDMITQGYLTGKLLPRFGTARLVLGGFLITACAYAINAILPIFPVVFFAYIYILIYALGSGLFEPAFGALVSSVASPQEQGRVQGASQSVQSITRILGPLVAVFLYQFNHSLPWILCVVLSIIGAGLLIRNKKMIGTLHASVHH